MKYFDIKPEPKTDLEVFNRNCNFMVTRLVNMVSIKKTIKPVIVENSEDWEFEYLDYGKGKRGFAVF